MATKRELQEAEDRAWTEFAELVDPLTDAELETPGYSPEWSAKDLVAHIGCWQAEAGRQLQRIANGTYEPWDRDVDETNAEFFSATHDLPAGTVRAECHAARTQLLRAFDALPEVTPEAAEWFEESAAGHCAEHLPRLREWVAELRGGGR